MISLLIGAILAALFVALIVARVRYGSLRVSELPVLMLSLLAGSEERKRLRLILEHRDRAVIPPTRPEAGPPPRPKTRREALFAEDRRAMQALAQQRRGWKGEQPRSCPKCNEQRLRGDRARQHNMHV